MKRPRRNFKKILYRLYISNKALVPDSYDSKSFFETLIDDIEYYYFSGGHAIGKPLKMIRNNHFELPASFFNIFII